MNCALVILSSAARHFYPHFKNKEKMKILVNLAALAMFFCLMAKLVACQKCPRGTVYDIEFNGVKHCCPYEFFHPVPLGRPPW